MQFSPCRGGDNCTQGGTHCQGCGRSHEEIAKTSALVGNLVKHVLDMDYENVAEFTAFVAEKAAKKVAMARMQDIGVGVGIQLK